MSEVSDEKADEIMKAVEDAGIVILIRQRRSMIEILSSLLEVPQELVHEVIKDLRQSIIDGMVRDSEGFEGEVGDEG